MLGEPLTPIRRELLNLKKVGFLKRSRAGSLIYYKVNSSFLLFQELKSMIEKTEDIRNQKIITCGYKNSKPLNPLGKINEHSKSAA
ncbi:MAG: hypothetical protein KKH94_05075 [Candidatus Omnitrophica bacterium]|nr:hypothetical protein [Candidatus Omnitrophota bacterium]